MRLNTKFSTFMLTEKKAGDLIIPPNIPNTKNFWHGGNLDNHYDEISHKKGRYEYGAGLYLTTHYSTAAKYAKGGRKLYLVTIEIGNDIDSSYLDFDKINSFIDEYVIVSKRKEINNRLAKYMVDGKIKASYFNNIILNENSIKPVNMTHLRQFYINNNIDYDIIYNAYGWGEEMMVLYNMKKIVNIIKIKPTDNIEILDLH